MNIIIKPSNKPDKKYTAIIDNKKSINFGANGMSDYTLHKDTDRKNRYIQRHKKNEDWNNIYTAGFWSKNILWNKKTLNESIKDTNKKYNVNIKLQK